MAGPNDIFLSSSLPELNVEVEVDQFALAALMPLVSRQPESTLRTASCSSYCDSSAVAATFEDEALSDNDVLLGSRHDL
jgi:hypothetical protein